VKSRLADMLLMPDEPVHTPMPGADAMSRRELSRQKKLEANLPISFLQAQYLPQKLDDCTVLLQEENGLWRADNSMLQASTQGVAFRGSKELDDRVAGLILPWRSTVAAEDEGDGWVKVTEDGYRKVMAECDRLLGEPPWPQLRVVLQRVQACEAALSAAAAWKSRRLPGRTIQLPGHPQVSSPSSKIALQPRFSSTRREHTERVLTESFRLRPWTSPKRGTWSDTTSMQSMNLGSTAGDSSFPLRSFSPQHTRRMAQFQEV